MIRPGSEGHPLRVAVVGSGPAGFFVVEHLFGKAGPAVAVDLFERLPVPYGLVRFGVAPDHLKIKNVVRKFAKTASDPRFRFFGNVEFGRDLTLEDLRAHYHATVFATGAQTDRRLGVPGEDLARSEPATAFVAWYNGHPDFRDLAFDLSVEKVAVVGVGNVAVDVARILCRTPGELEQSDIAAHALDALRDSRVREVVVLGRRGAAQAAFTNPEVKELGQLGGADCVTVRHEVALDPVSLKALGGAPDREIARKLEILQSYAVEPSPSKPRRLTLRFGVSPVELIDDGHGGVGGMRIVRNRLEFAGGKVRAVPTAEFEHLDVSMVFRSVGYRGVALPGVPFREDRGTIPHDEGRVLDAPGGRVVPGLYVAGWIKRGPSGVIGTNKPDAGETVDRIVEDAASGRLAAPSSSAPSSVESLLAGRGVRALSFDDWLRIDAAEIAAGQRCGRPRVKSITLAEVDELLGR